MYLTDSLQGIDRHLMIAAEEINFPSNSDRSITYTYLLKIQLQRQQIGVSYSTYHYWRRKCSVDRNSIKQELVPISLKQSVMESSPEGQVPHGVSVLFPNGLRAHFGNGSEEILMELFTQSLRGGHV